MVTDLTVDDIVEMFDLKPLEGEGGFVRRTWCRPASIDDPPEASCILYLITPESFSALHRLRYDEMFHFYLGDPCRAVSLSRDGVLVDVTLGQDIRSGMKVQHLVPGGSWQGTKLHDGGTWALVGTTMSPGFHVSGFELATPDLIGDLAPEWRGILREFLANQDEA